jgi:hypothetical protein
MIVYNPATRADEEKVRALVDAAKGHDDQLTPVHGR